jgi:hypothetical protein
LEIPNRNDRVFRQPMPFWKCQEHALGPQLPALQACGVDRRMQHADIEVTCGECRLYSGRVHLEQIEGHGGMAIPELRTASGRAP